jgi:hypothetical protein
MEEGKVKWTSFDLRLGGTVSASHRHVFTTGIALVVGHFLYFVSTTRKDDGRDPYGDAPHYGPFDN